MPDAPDDIAPDASSWSPTSPPGAPTGYASDNGGYDDTPSYASVAALDTHEAAVSAIASVDPDLASALAGTWGTDLRENLRFADRAREALATPELVAEVEAAGLGNSPHLVRALAAIGRRLAAEAGNPSTVPSAQELAAMLGAPPSSSPPPSPPAAPAAGWSLDQVKAEIEAMGDQLAEPVSRRDSWQRRWTALFEAKVALEAKAARPPATSPSAIAALDKQIADMEAKASRVEWGSKDFQDRRTRLYEARYGTSPA